MKFLIERTYLVGGTQGELFTLGGAKNHFCYTIERAKGDSDHPCIPEGTFTAERYFSPANNAIVWRLNVPNRTMIEFHPANWPHELLGCIAPGDQLATGLNGEPGVGESRLAWHRFMGLTSDETQITFIITEKAS